MLTKQLTAQFEQGNFELFDFEAQYAEKHGILPETVAPRTLKFDVLERCNKETEELIAAESAAFLTTPISYFKEHPEEFIYAETQAFDTIRIDAIAFEFDEMFKTYTALFGLKVQKKYEESLRKFLTKVTPEKYSLSFAGNDGLWEVNIFLTELTGKETLAETYQIIYRFIFACIEAIEHK